MFKNQFEGSAFRLVAIRSLVVCFLILSVFLPYVKITSYYAEQVDEHVFWFYSLSYESVSYAGSQDHIVYWSVEWYTLPIFAFSFVLMYFGLKKRYTFDLGVIVFALFLGWLTLPRLISPVGMGGGDFAESEALIGSYMATVVLAIYGPIRLYFQRATVGLEADRIPPPESVEQSEVVKRRVILVLAFLSFVLPFAVEYEIHHSPVYETALSTAYHWFGKGFEFDTSTGGRLRFGLPLTFALLFLPMIYLPLIMMWLGRKRTKLFTNGFRLFAVYWVWHLLFFLQPFYVAEARWSETIIAPTVGIVFFPTILLLYVFTFLFESERINRFLLESGLKGLKVQPKAFLKKCLKCGKEIPLASEECSYCGAKQPEINYEFKRGQEVPKVRGEMEQGE